MQRTRHTGETASDMMWDAGRGGAGPWVHCSCGKDHTVPCDDDDESYDLNDNFYYIELDGNLFVHECEGCQKKLGRYERFIWENKDHIRQYLKTRVDQEKAWADQQKLLNDLAGI